jgi:hypothetical protein
MAWASRVAESLVDLIMLAPPGDQAKLLADAMSNLGQIYLEKTGAVEPGESSSRH